MSTRRLRVILVLVTLVTAACTAGPGTGGTLEGTRWVLSSMDQGGALVITPESVFADAEFAVHRVSGFAGCNSYDSVYTAGGRTLLVSAPASTLMACDEAIMAFETRYLELLQASRHYTARRDTLTVFDSERREILRFDAAPRNPLLGTWDVVGYGVPPSTVVGLVEGTRMTAVFGIGSVGGFAGCNTYSGTSGTNGTVVRISKLATTQVACEQAAMDQETAFLSALEGASRIDDRGTSLNLTDRNGRLLVALQRPSPVAAPSASPGASGEPTAEPTATIEATPTATTKPTATPTPTPTATPEPTAQPTATPEPTAAPTATPTATPAPSQSPPVVPPTATCDLLAAGGPVLAGIVYPGTWSTPAEPPELACRYFDPAPIETPADPATLDTAVRADVLTTPYADAVTAATAAAAWTVALTSEFDVRGVAVTCVGGVALADTDGVAAGSGRYACMADVKAAGTVVIFTVGTPGDPLFLSDSAVVGLMTLASTFTPTG